MSSRKKEMRTKCAAQDTAPANKNQESTRPQTGAGVTEYPPAADFPVVGIGASAGGLAAFEAFFSGMPADQEPGMAFVLVQHLAPDHKSILTELIRRVTRMQVYEVTDGIKVEPDCVYIIPPNHDMALLNGVLQLLEPSAPRGQRLPIDFFFRSLAQDRHERAICIVLSGTGSDGTQGIRAVKGEGGMVMAQSPATTEYDGMPRSALATGLVDYELPPPEMPAQLIAYVSRAFRKSHHPETAVTPRSDSMLQKAFILLRSRTGHDFSRYKTGTIHRRIGRRMAVHQIESLEEYVRYLQQTPAEVDVLFQDLLIGVTGFFRDPEAFSALEQRVIPRLFEGNPPGSTIRAWLPGCSTGEEAYSLAILIQERLSELKQHYNVQIFATDIDGEAIATARRGLYPESILDGIPPERRHRFFREEESGVYRINKAIRDMLIFSEQNLIKDPPFSRLDLISCRNLLIYLNADLQKKLIPLFHYALKPGGMLFLGASETVGEFGDLFAALDRKHKLYQRKENLPGTRPKGVGLFLPSLTDREEDLPQTAVTRSPSSTVMLRELIEQALLLQVAPVGALVNGKGDIFYLHGCSGQYLELAPGEPGVSNILKMAREGLRHELTMAIHKAVISHETVQRLDIPVKTNGGFTPVNLTVSPIEADSPLLPSSPLYLLALAEAPLPLPGQADVQAGDDSADADVRIGALRQELRAKEEYLQTANEELETSNEELKSSNEELQSVNEELQSTNEELETSKEELQSVNEELATVNAELQSKVTELSRAMNDMNNLLAGTGIGTVFVDHQLRILRFTPAATEFINLIPADMGRPVGHIASNLVGYDSLVPDIQTVLATLIPHEVEVTTAEGKFYTMRILPYRTLDNVVEGAVVTFVDITEAKASKDLLIESESRFRLLAESLPQLVWTCRADGLYDYISPQLSEYAGVPLEQQPGSGWFTQVHPDDRDAVMTAWDRAVATGDPLHIESRIRHSSGTYQWFDIRARAVCDPDGKIVKWCGTNTLIYNR